MRYFGYVTCFVSQESVVVVSELGVGEDYQANFGGYELARRKADAGY
jgi:hypothetical protein